MIRAMDLRNTILLQANVEGVEEMIMSLRVAIKHMPNGEDRDNLVGLKAQLLHALSDHKDARGTEAPES